MTQQEFLRILAIHLNNNSVLGARKRNILKAGFIVQVFENYEIVAMYIVVV